MKYFYLKPRGERRRRDLLQLTSFALADWDSVCRVPCCYSCTHTREFVLLVLVRLLLRLYLHRIQGSLYIRACIRLYV